MDVLCGNISGANQYFRATVQISNLDHRINTKGYEGIELFYN